MRRIALATSIMICQIQPCFGQATGQPKTSKPTSQKLQAVFNTVKPNLPVSTTSKLAPQFGPTSTNGLPVCRLDSFIVQAGSKADLIYGDEGANGPTPYENFTPEHRINAGIMGSRAAGLTTGHRSTLPAAWGGDEVVGGTEWVQTGSNTSFDMSSFIPTP